VRNSFFLLSAFLFILVSTAESRDNPFVVYKKGAAAAIYGDFDNAIDIFKSLAESNPNYSLAHYGLGKAYLNKNGKLEDAIRHLKISVSLDKRFAKGYFYLGLAYQLSSKYNLAIKAYKDAYNFSNSQIEALFNIGAMYEITGRIYQSKIYFNRYIKLKTKDDTEIIF
jgi:tetratricopeptide (TPR) repeat protein